MKKIALASDHAGFDMKNVVINWLKSENYEVKDFGAFSTESADYPDFAHPLADAVSKGEYLYGITLCGSGNGINMTANKHSRLWCCFMFTIFYNGRV